MTTTHNKVEAIVKLNARDLNKYGYLDAIVTFYSQDSYSIIKPENNCEIYHNSYTYHTHMVTYLNSIHPIDKSKSWSFTKIYKNEGKFAVTKFIYIPD